MKNNQHIFKSWLLSLMLVIGFGLTPILAFSQQTEPAKRVNVVVTLQSKSTEKEVIQIPADNEPKVIHGANYYAARRVKPVIREADEVLKPATKAIPIKATTAALKPSKTVSSKPLATTNKPVTKVATVVKTTPKKEAPIVVAKPVTKVAAIKPAPLKPQPAAPVKTATLKPTTLKPEPVTTTAQTTNSLKPTAPQKSTNHVVSSKATKAMVAEERAKVNAEDSVDNPNANNTNVQASNSDKQNTISYVWIGVVLIIAGVILGLLFGRTAFLVSFVGVIFILLGIFIF